MKTNEAIDALHNLDQNETDVFVNWWSKEEIFLLLDEDEKEKLENEDFDKIVSYIEQRIDYSSFNDDITYLLKEYIAEMANNRKRRNNNAK
jgi:hypothetical protein